MLYTKFVELLSIEPNGETNKQNLKKKKQTNYTLFVPIRISILFDIHWDITLTLNKHKYKFDWCLPGYHEEISPLPNQTPLDPMLIVCLIAPALLDRIPESLLMCASDPNQSPGEKKNSST